MSFQRLQLSYNRVERSIHVSNLAIQAGIHIVMFMDHGDLTSGDAKAYSACLEQQRKMADIGVKQ